MLLHASIWSTITVDHLGLLFALGLLSWCGVCIRITFLLELHNDTHSIGLFLQMLFQSKFCIVCKPLGFKM